MSALSAKLGQPVTRIDGIAKVTGAARYASDEPVHMGDSDLPPIMIAGGSNNAASASLVVAKACEQLRDRIAQAAVKDILAVPSMVLIRRPCSCANLS
jgi:CO/xanthine dehydrogenase Mo-binding subunit